MNRRRWITGFALFSVLVLAVVVFLAFAHAWTPPKTDAARCFIDFAHSQWPKWIGCTMSVHENLAAGLIGAAGALFGAWLAFSGLKEQIGTERQNEFNRRNRKHAAVRAMLPLALAQVIAYAERSARALDELVNKCEDETLPAKAAPECIVEPLPSETLNMLAEFVEYSDAVNVEVVEATVAWIQIHDSRMRRLVQDNHDPSKEHVVVQTEIEGRIIDAASIYAGAAAVFDYARRRRQQLPDRLSWDAVRIALRNMRLWDNDHPRLHKILTDRETKCIGPFESLRADS
jgi:hypothetical protein